MKTKIDKQITGRGERLLWLDALKGFAMLAVVLGHVLLGYIGNHAFPAANNTMQIVNDWIYVWHMPLLLALSGYTYQMSCVGQNGIGFNRKKVKRNALNFLIIYLLFVVALGLLKNIFASYVNAPVELGEEYVLYILFPSQLMWYLWVLAIYYLLFSQLSQLENRC